MKRLRQQLTSTRPAAVLSGSRLLARTAAITALAAIGLLATTSAASAEKVAGYQGPLRLYALGSEHGSRIDEKELVIGGQQGFAVLELTNARAKDSSGRTVHVHLHIRPEESGRFLLADELFPQYTRCSTLEVGKKCEVIVLSEPKEGPARATLEIRDGPELAYRIPMLAVR